MSIFDRLFGGHHGGHHGRRRGGHHDDGRRDYYGAGEYGSGGIGCPGCKTLNASGARFCQQCGISLVPNLCKQCGASLQAGAKFCGQCGKAAP